MDDDDFEPYDEGPDREPTWRERVSWWFARRRASLSRWYRRTFHRKQWEADRARFAASCSDYDKALKELFKPDDVTAMASRRHPLSELTKSKPSVQ